MRDLTNDFIDKFLKKVNLQPVGAEASIYYVIRHSVYDIEELVVWIDRHLDKKYIIDIFKIQDLLRNDQTKQKGV